METVITYKGTGVDIVDNILASFGVNLVVVETVKDVKDIKFDGAILLGGADIDTKLYGEENNFAKGINPQRDAVETAIIGASLRQKTPMLGICRGMQLLTATFGGALYQDIYKQNRTTFHPYYHKVEYSGPLKNVAPEAWVNSLHHQALRVLPSGFKICARARQDDIVEAIWKPGVLGVQFHPELLFIEDTRWVNIFRWFLKGLV